LIALPDSISPTSLAERPDIRAAFLQTQAIDYSARAAHKALLPQINLKASAFKNGETLKKAFNGDLLWQLVGGLTQPLFNGGQLRAISRQKSAEAEAYWWQYRNTVLKAMLEVEQAMAEDKMLVRRLEQKKTMLKDMEKKTASAEERFSGGEMALPDYLQIKTERIETQIELSAIELLYIKNRLTLVMALGLPMETILENKNEKS
jgi:outer membrane protein TolC